MTQTSLKRDRQDMSELTSDSVETPLAKEVKFGGEYPPSPPRRTYFAVDANMSAFSWDEETTSLLTPANPNREQQESLWDKEWEELNSSRTSESANSTDTSGNSSISNSYALITEQLPRINSAPLLTQTATTPATAINRASSVDGLAQMLASLMSNQNQAQAAEPPRRNRRLSF